MSSSSPSRKRRRPSSPASPRSPLPPPPGLRILHEDPWLIFVDKPANLRTVPGRAPSASGALGVGAAGGAVVSAAAQNRDLWRASITAAAAAQCASDDGSSSSGSVGGAGSAGSAGSAASARGDLVRDGTGSSDGGGGDTPAARVGVSPAPPSLDDPRCLASLLGKLASFGNVPRNQTKFIRFCRRSLGCLRPAHSGASRGPRPPFPPVSSDPPNKVPLPPAAAAAAAHNAPLAAAATTATTADEREAESAALAAACWDAVFREWTQVRHAAKGQGASLLRSIQQCRPEATLVHRLDEETSGVVVFARTAASQASLGAQFEQRTVKKAYLAVVRGVVAADHQTIDLPIGRNPEQALEQMVDRENGRPARTECKVLERGSRCVTVLCVCVCVCVCVLVCVWWVGWFYRGRCMYSSRSCIAGGTRYLGRFRRIQARPTLSRSLDPPPCVL